MYRRARLKGQTDQMWPVGRSLPTTDLWCANQKKNHCPPGEIWVALINNLIDFISFKYISDKLIYPYVLIIHTCFM